MKGLWGPVGVRLWQAQLPLRLPVLDKSIKTFQDGERRCRMENHN